MTNKEAIEVIKEIKVTDDCLTQYLQGFDEALDMAIQALEQTDELLDYVNQSIEAEKKIHA